MPPRIFPSPRPFRATTNDHQIYQIFTDAKMRRKFNDYDAIAVLDWKSVEAREDSLARLYHEVFGRPRSKRWWVMAADAPPLEAGEAEQRGDFFEKRLLGSDGSGGGGGGRDAHLVWSINGKAIVCKTPAEASQVSGTEGEKERVDGVCSPEDGWYGVVEAVAVMWWWWWWWWQRFGRVVFSAPGVLKMVFNLPWCSTSHRPD